MRSVIALTAVALSACSTAQTSLPESLVIARPVTLTPAQIAAVERTVRANLKDPDSARFGALVAGSNNTGTIHVCGLVNAKNSYGGYGGMTMYAVELTGTNFKFEGMGEGIVFICDKQGLRPAAS